jgi:hypothetical protein
MARRPTNCDELPVEPLILTVRGQRVILDADLARVYGVPTRRLNEQVRRNAGRFPADFIFELTAQEVADLMSQIATSSSSVIRSQFAAGSHGGTRKPPLAFTEHGAIMAATVLNSPRAVQMSVFVVRAFVDMRQMLTGQSELARRLAELEKKLTDRLDAHETAITDVLQQLMLLLNPPPAAPPPRRRIGFSLKERRAAYRTGKGR